MKAEDDKLHLNSTKAVQQLCPFQHQSDLKFS